VPASVAFYRDVLGFGASTDGSDGWASMCGFATYDNNGYLLQFGQAVPDDAAIAPKE
jgi:hypothetical protein